MITCAVFCVTLLLGMPVAFSLGFSGLVSFLSEGVSLKMLVQRMFTSLDTFPFMAIPLFILAGELMNRSGLVNGLMRFCDMLVGHLVGGLGQVNVLASMFFGGMTGAAVADVCALGPVEIQMMTEAGYDRQFSTAITVASSIIGPIIPPSIPMVLYAISSGESIGALFLGGMLPGILLGLALMAGVYIISIRRRYPRRKKMVPLKDMVDGLRAGLLSLGMPAIIIGGIALGIVTPTEASALAVLYSLIVGGVVMRGLSLRDLRESLIETGVTTAAVFLVLGAAGIVSYVVTTQQVGAKLGLYLAAINMSPYVFLLVVNVLLLLVGCFLDSGAAIIIFAPILVPLAVSLGIHPIHFGVMMVFNLMIGLLTPPVGAVLYVGCRVGSIGFEELVRELVPFLAICIIALAIVTFVPGLTTYIPRLLGFI